MPSPAPLLGLFALAVTALVAGFVVANNTSICGLRRPDDDQQYHPLSADDASSHQHRPFGEFHPDGDDDADGWNDGWEHDDWDVEDTAAKA